MKQSHIKYIILSKIFILGFIFVTTSGFAQTELKVNPIEKIVNESDSMITIDIPPLLQEVILESQTGTKADSDLKPGVNKIAGYRIQVFSDGRNQNTLESRAKARGNVIVSKFPKYKGQVYTFSNSPNWYTRIGNFKTTSEANAALTELKKAFPSFSSEMRIVKSQIIVLKQ